MSQAQARSWWADVEHLREVTERRRAAHAPAPDGTRELVALAPDWRRAAAEHFDELAERGARERRPHEHQDHQALPERRGLAALDVGGRLATLLHGDNEHRSGPDGDVIELPLPTRRFARADEDDSERSGRFARADEDDSERSGRFAREPKPVAGRIVPEAAGPVVPQPRTAPAPERFARDAASTPPPAIADALDQRPRRLQELDDHLRPRPHASPAASGVERRTVEITGHASARGVPSIAARHARAAAEPTAAAARPRRRREPVHPLERLAARPDRLALWAFLLGVLLVIVAAASAHGG